MRIDLFKNKFGPYLVISIDIDDQDELDVIDGFISKRPIFDEHDFFSGKNEEQFLEEVRQLFETMDHYICLLMKLNSAYHQGDEDSIIIQKIQCDHTLAFDEFVSNQFYDIEIVYSNFEEIYYGIANDELIESNLESYVDKNYLNAYTKTSYICEELADEIKIGESVSADELCVITAYNPFSKKLDERINEQRNEQLKMKLDNLLENLAKSSGSEIKVYGARGEGEVSDNGNGDKWVEPSFLVIGLPFYSAVSLMKEFDQNAVVYCFKGKNAQLVWNFDTFSYP